jgi:hypothetical protein
LDQAYQHAVTGVCTREERTSGNIATKLIS